MNNNRTRNDFPIGLHTNNSDISGIDDLPATTDRRRRRRIRNTEASSNSKQSNNDVSMNGSSATDIKPQANQQKLLEAPGSMIGKLKASVGNLVTRSCLGLFMIFTFAALIWLGPLALTFFILFIQVMCFHEIIAIGSTAFKANNDMPPFRFLSCCFLITSDLYMSGCSLVYYFVTLLAKNDFGQSFLQYHLLVSFTMCTAGFITFVLKLKRRLYKKQFLLFSLTHLTLLIIVLQ